MFIFQPFVPVLILVGSLLIASILSFCFLFLFFKYLQNREINRSRYIELVSNDFLKYNSVKNRIEELISTKGYISINDYYDITKLRDKFDILEIKNKISNTDKN